MPRFRRISFVLVLALAACNAPVARPRVTPAATATPKVAAVSSATPTPPLVAVRAGVTGSVQIPAALISSNGASVISDQGTSLIGEGGNKWRLTALPAQGLAGIEVTLADLTGKPLAGVPVVKTDASGKFKLAAPAVDGPVEVLASIKMTDGRSGMMRARAVVTQGAGAAELTLASTFVAVVTDVPTFDAAAEARAIAATDARLDATDPPRLFDPDGIRKRMDDLAAAVAELRSALSALDKRFAAIEQKLDDLNKKIDTLVSPTPPTTALPSPPAVTVTSLALDSFVAMVGLGFDSKGGLFVTDFGTNRLSRIAPGEGGLVVAGNKSGYKDGVGLAAAFQTPLGLAVDAADVVYVADWNNAAIRKVVVDATGFGTVTTLAGGTEGFADGKGTAAHFRQPHDIATDPAGSLVVVDQLNQAIRRVTPDGTVTTIAGTGTAGYKDGPGKTAQFSDPISAAVTPDGTIYINDRGNSRIRKIDPAGEVTTVAGDGTKGDTDGFGKFARFNNPEDLAIDAKGRLVIVDSENNKIKLFDPVSGAVITLAGSGAGDFADGAGPVAKFNKPTGVAVAADGTLYIADSQSRMRLIK